MPKEKIICKYCGKKVNQFLARSDASAPKYAVWPKDVFAACETLRKAGLQVDATWDGGPISWVFYLKTPLKLLDISRGNVSVTKFLVTDCNPPRAEWVEVEANEEDEFLFCIPGGRVYEEGP